MLKPPGCSLFVEFTIVCFDNNHFQFGIDVLQTKAANEKIADAESAGKQSKNASKPKPKPAPVTNPWKKIANPAESGPTNGSGGDAGPVADTDKAAVASTSLDGSNAGNANSAVGGNRGVSKRVRGPDGKWPTLGDAVVPTDAAKPAPPMRALSGGDKGNRGPGGKKWVASTALFDDVLHPPSIHARRNQHGSGHDGSRGRSNVHGSGGGGNGGGSTSESSNWRVGDGNRQHSSAHPHSRGGGSGGRRGGRGSSAPTHGRSTAPGTVTG